jgi:hypothetical protein
VLCKQNRLGHLAGKYRLRDALLSALELKVVHAAAMEAVRADAAGMGKHSFHRIFHRALGIPRSYTHRATNSPHAGKPQDLAWLQQAHHNTPPCFLWIHTPTLLRMHLGNTRKKPHNYEGFFQIFLLEMTGQTRLNMLQGQAA